MVNEDRRRFLVEAVAARERAEAAVLELERSKAVCDEELRRSRRTDLVKQVTGRSSIEQALAEARRVVEGLDRTIAEASKEQQVGAGLVAGLSGVGAGGNGKVETRVVPSGLQDPGVGRLTGSLSRGV